MVSNKDFSNKIIYVIDDEEEFLDMIVDMIKMHLDVNIVKFTGVENALKKIQQGEIPNLIITDLKMPKMNGLQFLTMIRELAIDKPVLVMSGNVGKNEAMRSVMLNVRGVLEKPVAVNVLIDNIKKVLIEEEIASLSDSIEKEKNSLLLFLDSVYKTDEINHKFSKISSQISFLNSKINELLKMSKKI